MLPSTRDTGYERWGCGRWIALLEGSAGTQLTHPSALGTIVGTAGIAYSQMGGSKPASTSAPPPVEKDSSISAQSKDEEDL